MKPFVFAAGLMLIAGSALAAGVDLAVVSCAGNAGATSDIGTFDCAGGEVLNLLATFSTAESVPDLVALDMTMNLQVDGDVDLGTSANFWDFASANTDGFLLRQLRPATGCTGYLNTWSPAGSGAGVSAELLTPSSVRLMVYAYRPNILAVTANQPLFAVRLLIDAATEVSSGGMLRGCCLEAHLGVTTALPGTVSGDVMTPLMPGPLTNGVVTINSSAPCAAVSARRHTWGQLKSLYR